jgi:PTS system fructose-specific IIC component/PTS system nitrogen regulatory IIA component
MGILLKEIFTPESIVVNLKAKTKKDAFSELVDIIASLNSGNSREEILTALWDRESKMSTGIASGVAIPHAFCGRFNSIVGAIGISRVGIEYGALDQKPVHIVFMLAIGGPAQEKHLRVLNQISKLVQSEALALIRKANSAQDIHAILSQIH